VSGFRHLSGGADNVVKVVSSIRSRIRRRDSRRCSIRAESRVAALSGTALGAGLKGVATGLALVGAAASAGDFIGNKIGDFLTADFRALEKSQAEARGTFKASEQDKVEGRSESDQAASNQYCVPVEANHARVYFRERQCTNPVERVAEGFEKTLSRITGAREKFAEEIGKRGRRGQRFRKRQPRSGSRSYGQGRRSDVSEQPEGRAGSVADFRLTDRAQQLGNRRNSNCRGRAVRRRGCNRTRLEGL